jgi:Haem-binding domain
VSSRNLTSTAVSAICLVLLAAQFVPVQRTNPPSLGTLSAPPEIEAKLRRACYDCHSNETQWPWYSRVAPVSWFIVCDVTRGRKEVNFSEWGSYYPATRRRKLEWIGRSLHEEKMPPWPYRLMHPGARLSETDLAALERWIESALSTPSAQGLNK